MNQAHRQETTVQALELLLDRLPSVLAIYGYGSFFSDQAGPDSDVDLAVLLPPDSAIENKLELIAKLSDIFHRSVDLVDMQQAGHWLRKEILSAGPALYARAPDSLLAWEASAMSAYAQHNEAISDILDQFQRTGVGYAG